MLLAALSLTLSSACWAAYASADLKPEKIFLADSKKNESYVRDGLVTGGDKAVSDVVVRDIRRAANGRFERLVVDLEGNVGGEPAAIPRPPFYQVSVTPDQKRVIFTVFGRPRLHIDTHRIMTAFRKSQAVEKLMLLPTLDEESWSFVLQLRKETPIEVFELTQPVRVIMDLKLKP